MECKSKRGTFFFKNRNANVRFLKNIIIIESARVKGLNKDARVS